MLAEYSIHFHEHPMLEDRAVHHLCYHLKKTVGAAPHPDQPECHSLVNDCDDAVSRKVQFETI